MTQEQFDFYQENGEFVIEDFRSPDELETWRRQVDEAVARRDKRLLDDGSEMDEDSE